ncbi:hypothetical protein VPH35_127214 [Triticum aestivum]
MYTTPDLSRQHLPLIMCPDCGEVQVETNISGVEGPNEGKRFYNGLLSEANSHRHGKYVVFAHCVVAHGPEKCGWFKWEDAYAAILRRRQAAALRAQNAARQQPPVMPVQIPVPLVQANARGGPNWMTIALMVNIIVNIILTMALIGRT